MAGSAALPRSNDCPDPVEDQAAVALGVVGEQGRQDGFDLSPGEWGELQLGAVQLLRGVALACEGRMKGARRQAGEQGVGRNVHGGELGVGQETGAVVEDRAEVIDSALLQHGDVVEMAVVVEK